MNDGARRANEDIEFRRLVGLLEDIDRRLAGPLVVEHAVGSAPKAAREATMAVEKVVTLKSGGAVVLSLESVNLFALTEPERQFLAEVGDALRKYERKAQAENGGESGRGAAVSSAVDTESVKPA